MPSGMAAAIREAVTARPDHERRELVLERSSRSKTGFVNVIEVKGKFQARYQVPGDGRGGSKTRRQHSLPGPFDKAEDAAFMLAQYKVEAERNDSVGRSPEKQNKKHKSRKLAPAAVEPLPPPVNTPPVTTFAMPLSMPMWHLPVAAASPLPVQSLTFVPPRF